MIDERALYRNPRGFVFEILSEGWRMLAEPPVSLLDWLRRQYQRQGPDSEFGQAVCQGLFALLKEPDETAARPQGGEALAQALELIRSLRITQAQAPLRELVQQSALRRPLGGYTDLHGRAMTALVAIDGVDAWELWEGERAHPEYAPMAFALVRERLPERVPDTLPDAARFGFLRVAVRTIAAEHGAARAEDRGFKLLREGAARLREVHDPVIAAEFQLALAELGLHPGLHLRIMRELDPRVGAVCAVNTAAAPVGERVTTLLGAGGVHVADGFWRVPGRPVVLVVDGRAVDPYEAETLDFHLGRPDAAVAVFPENTAIPSTLHPRLRPTAVPFDDPEAAAEIVSREVFRVILSLTELIPDRRRPRSEARTTATSARGAQTLSAVQRFGSSR